MAEAYSEQKGQMIEDEVWIPDVARRGWIILTKDDGMRKNPTERAALRNNAARVFVVTTATLTGEALAFRFVHNRERILRRATAPGPYVYGVYVDDVRPLRLRDD